MSLCSDPERVRLCALDLKSRRDPRAARTLNPRPIECAYFRRARGTREFASRLAAVAVLDPFHPTQRRDEHGRARSSHIIDRARGLFPSLFPTERVDALTVVVTQDVRRTRQSTSTLSTRHPSTSLGIFHRTGRAGIAHHACGLEVPALVALSRDFRHAPQFIRLVCRRDATAHLRPQFQLRSKSIVRRASERFHRCQRVINVHVFESQQIRGDDGARTRFTGVTVHRHRRRLQSQRVRDERRRFGHRTQEIREVIVR